MMLVPVCIWSAVDGGGVMGAMRSSGWPMRPMLILARTLSGKAVAWRKGLVRGVSMKVGAMVLDRMRWGARSRAMALFMPSSAHLEEIGRASCRERVCQYV